MIYISLESSISQAQVQLTSTEAAKDLGLIICVSKTRVHDCKLSSQLAAINYSGWPFSWSIFSDKKAKWQMHVFFLGGTEGKFCSPLTNCRPHFLTKACPHPTEFCPWKFQKFYLIFLSIFDYFFAQNCIRKLYFKLKTPKFALILL